MAESNLLFADLQRAFEIRDRRLGELICAYVEQPDPPETAPEGYDFSKGAPKPLANDAWTLPAVQSRFSKWAMYGKSDDEKKAIRSEAWRNLMAADFPPPRLQLGDMLIALYDIDDAAGTGYHPRLRAFLRDRQLANHVVGGAMTDPKGDRSRGPADQDDPALFVHVVERRDGGVVIRGAKAHQTGCLNSHWLLVMPTMRLRAGDEAYAISCAVPVDAPGITYVLGRQASDGRALEGIDQGNATYAGQEALIVFEDVFVPDELVFMDGEVDWAAELVERFTTYHRRSYVCKTGLGDVLIGAAAQIAEDNGVPKASHIQDKLVEMAHLNETLYGTGIAASHASTPRPAGNWEPDPMLANVCKHNVTRFPFELGRLAQDLAGGLVATGPSDKDLEHPEVGPLLERLLRAAPGVPTKRRLRVLRLIENMTMGRNAVGYLTESLHGAGSPQAQRIQIRRMMDVEGKKALARRLAGVDDDDQSA